MLKKISWTVWKISLVWLICVYIHFLLYMVFNLDWYFINAAIPATAGIAISIVGYFAIVGFKNLCKMSREMKEIFKVVGLMICFAVALTFLSVFLHFLLTVLLDIAMVNRKPNPLSDAMLLLILSYFSFRILKPLFSFITDDDED